MAGNILRLGGSSGLVIGEDGNESGVTSLTGATALVDFGAGGFQPSATAEAYVFRCWVSIAATSLANLKTAIETLDLWVSRTKDRSVEVFAASGALTAGLIVGDNVSYIEGVQSPDIVPPQTASGACCADVEIIFTAARFLDSAGTGTEGGAEDPTGLQDALTYGIQHSGDGTYEIAIRGRFRNTYGGATARENAYAWVRAWRGALPSFLPAAEKFEPVSIDTEGENQNLEVTATLRVRSIKSAIRSRITLPAWVRNIVTEIASRGGSKISPTGGGRAVGSQVVISGAIGLITDSQTFGPFVPADIDGKATFAAIFNIAQQAVVAAKTQSGQSLRETSGLAVSLSESGSTATFTQTFAGGSGVTEWSDEVDNDEQFLQTYIRIYDGSERRKDGPPGGPVVTASQRYRTASISGWERPSVPAGFDVVKITDTPVVEDQIDARGRVTGKVYRVSGVRLLHRTPGRR